MLRIDLEEWDMDKVKNLPVVVKASMEERLKSKVTGSESFDKFVKTAVADARFKTTGRVAQQLEVSILELKLFIQPFLGQDGRNTTRYLSDGETNYCAIPSYYYNSGRMKWRGVEFSYLPSLKYQIEGDRAIVAVCFAELATYAKSTQAASKTWTYNGFMTFFSEVAASEL